jgi:hypothetical protein
MKCQCVGRELELARDCTGGKPLRSRLHQQTEYIETAILGERGQGRDGIGVFHISMVIEMKAAVKKHFDNG